VQTPHLDFSAIKTVVFDFDGTLTDFLAADRQALRALHQHAQIQVSLEQFIEISVEEIMAFHERVGQGLENPLEMHLQRLERTFERLDAKWQPEHLERYRTRMIAACTALEGAHELLSALRPHYKLGLLTNAYDAPEQRERIHQSGLEHYFDEIVVAAEIGIYKPEPGIFTHLLERLGAQPSEAVYIGDSPGHDVLGAIGAGMQAILVRPGAPHPRAGMTVSHLTELYKAWVLP